jgi:3-oxoacyl-[acyl-carrier protein] reductase
MKRALVTGGSGLIGSAISKRLAQEGYHVIVHAHKHAEQAQRVAQDIVQTGGSAETILFDVGNNKETRDKLEQLLTGGEIQVLVNNAGTYDDAPMAGMSYEQWSQVINVSLNSFFNVTQPLLLPMMSTRWGRIVTISSVSGITGNRGQTNYAAAKAGLHGATKSLALELATRGVTVNAIAPGVVQTNDKKIFDDEKIKALVPMKRAGTPEEIAALVAYLVSDAASYITGQIISVNGAMA